MGNWIEYLAALVMLVGALLKLLTGSQPIGASAVAALCLFQIIALAAGRPSLATALLSGTVIVALIVVGQELKHGRKVETAARGK